MFVRRHAAFVKNVERRMLEVPDTEARKEVSLSSWHVVPVSGRWAEEGAPDLGLVSGAPGVNHGPGSHGQSLWGALTFLADQLTLPSNIPC